MSEAVTATVSPNFHFWNSVDPTQFLVHDWENPSRQWAAEKAVAMADGGTLTEVGPGPGVDYARVFSDAVKAGLIQYTAYEGSATLYDSLRARFPEATWQRATIADLPPLSADVVYARHVLEHQPALEPAMGTLLAAARRAAVIVWYRPPGPLAFHEVWAGVHCHTFARESVLQSVVIAGFRLEVAELFDSGDEVWVLERQ